MKRLYFLLIAGLLTSLNSLAQTDVVTPPNNSGGPMGQGAWLRFLTGSPVSIQEYWGLNLYSGGATQPVKVLNSSLLVGYPSNGADFGIGNALISGNVGIGVGSTPGFKLMVGGSGILTNFSNLTDQDITFSLSAPGASDKYGLIAPQTATNLALGVGGVEKMRITNMGRLGIGTTGPRANLEVAPPNTSDQSRPAGIFRLTGHQTWGHALTLATDDSNGDDARMLFAYRAGAKRWSLGGISNSTRFSLWEDGGDGIYGSGWGTERFTVLEGGNVGVGTEAPLSLFQVEEGCSKASLGDASGAGLAYGTSYLGFNAARASNNTWQSSGDGLHNGGGVIYSNIAGEMYFAPIETTSGSDKVLSDDDIRSRIKLRISPDGVTHAKAIMVETANFPDYVFQPTYHLKSLAEVKAYIDKNKHLPDMPAAAQVEKEGVNLGEMNKALLKKVEELTLYMIELKKENQHQNRLIQQLWKKNNRNK